jgi:hypothetical protein
MSAEEIHQISTRVINLEDAFVKLVQLTVSMDERMDTLLEAQANSEARIAALADAQIRTEQAQIKTEQALTRLAESQARTDEKLAETDERLNSLITVVERIISEGRNGKS